MKITGKLVASWMFFATMVALMGWLATSPTRAQAQSGFNAVYQSSSTIPSSSFIDASAYSGADLCAKINAVLTSTLPVYPSAGAVIDARGIGSGTTQSCAASPWAGFGTSNPAPPSHILLPSGTITIAAKWALPQGTHISGEGSTTTTILAKSSFSPMIQMGDVNCTPTSVCFDISVDNLALDGGGNTIDGVDNNNAEELSYVDHVRFIDIEGTGLSIPAGGDNSGPYSNLYFTGGAKAGSATACVRITGVSSSGTRGIHGMTCVTTTADAPQAAVYVDGNNNTIEDLHVEGFQDGVLVGDSAPAAGNVLVNINGGANGSSTVTNVVHISSNTTSGAPNVSNLAVLGAVRYFGTNTIQDDLTSTTLTDVSVGMYVLGEVAAINGEGGVVGYSRFTTSPSVPTWVVSGVSAPPTSLCKTGSLYSNTAGTSGSHNTLYVCEGGNWLGK
jgi:hypothetical protein